MVGAPLSKNVFGSGSVKVRTLAGLREFCTRRARQGTRQDAGHRRWLPMVATQYCTALYCAVHVAALYHTRCCTVLCCCNCAVHGAAIYHTLCCTVLCCCTVAALLCCVDDTALHYFATCYITAPRLGRDGDGKPYYFMCDTIDILHCAVCVLHHAGAL